MFVTKKTDGALRSQGYIFKRGERVAVKKPAFDYLKKTFPNNFTFEEVVEPKPKPKAKVKESPKKDD